jgi:hypothetical protein
VFSLYILKMFTLENYFEIIQENYIKFCFYWYKNYRNRNLIEECTDNGQRYSYASNFPYIFHIKLQFFRNLSWSQFTPDFDNFYINKNRILCSFLVNDWVNLKIIWKEGDINKVLSKKVLTKLITYPGAAYFSTKKNRIVKEPLVSSVGRFGV